MINKVVSVVRTHVLALILVITVMIHGTFVCPITLLQLYVGHTNNKPLQVVVITVSVEGIRANAEEPAGLLHPISKHVKAVLILVLDAIHVPLVKTRAITVCLTTKKDEMILRVQHELLTVGAC